MVHYLGPKDFSMSTTILEVTTAIIGATEVEPQTSKTKIKGTNHENWYCKNAPNQRGINLLERPLMAIFKSNRGG
tara:strand:- start:3727 stop:3951 length:225 start_codon:yes stop_codon:yes gene_type:complete